MNKVNNYPFIFVWKPKLQISLWEVNTKIKWKQNLFVFWDYILSTKPNKLWHKKWCSLTETIVSEDNCQTNR